MNLLCQTQSPGKLYQIKTVINDAENPEVPLMQETLTLRNIEFSDKIVAKKQD